MRTYDFTKNYEKLLTPDIVALLTQIHEYKGCVRRSKSAA